MTVYVLEEMSTVESLRPSEKSVWIKASYLDARKAMWAAASSELESLCDTCTSLGYSFK